MSIRVPADLADFTQALAKETGWSDTKALLWLAEGCRRVMRDAATREQLNAERDAWVNRYAQELRAQTIIRDANAAVRATLAGKKTVDAIATLKRHKKLQEKTA